MGDVKITIGDMNWIFTQPLNWKMMTDKRNGSVPGLQKFCLDIESRDNPLVFRKITDGKVTEYIKLAGGRYD